MIATLRGVVAEIETDRVVLECAGVGYGLIVTGADHGLLQSGKEAQVYVHEHIKEDAHDLFGFLAKDTKRLFEQLLTVKNVGPKVAIALLDIDKIDGVRQAIADGDIKTLQTAKGVGKRAAEQIVVELRDKVGLSSGDSADSVVSRGAASRQRNDEAFQGLVALGYSDIDALEALANVDPDLSVEQRITQALKR
jgi:Holliday junction DNA helicase RuvA